MREKHEIGDCNTWFDQNKAIRMQTLLLVPPPFPRLNLGLLRNNRHILRRYRDSLWLHRHRVRNRRGIGNRRRVNRLHLLLPLDVLPRSVRSLERHQLQEEGENADGEGGCCAC